MSEIPFGPQGHIPGFHIPGTTTPIGAVVEAQQQAEQAELAKNDQKRRANLLLLLSN
jgi:hypothetical protein